MAKVAPSILSANFANLGRDIAKCTGADMLHVDVMDGRFVPNITIGPVVVKDLNRITSLPLDVHLMIVEPEKYLTSFLQAGADFLTVHVEACPHLHRTLGQIKEAGIKAGVAINPATPVNFLPYVIDLVDLILVMSVNPGFGGQSFIPESLEKIAEVRKLINQSAREIILEVDGGVNNATAPSIVAAGADLLVAGSAIFKAPDISAAIRELQQA